MTFLNFFFKFVPKFIIFYLLFFIYNYGFKDFGYTYGNSYIFQFFLKRRSERRNCIKHIENIFTPFYYQYVKCDDERDLIGYKECFSFFYYYSSEFYCFFFTVFLTYICFKLKSLLFDSIIAILVVINFLLTFLYYPSWKSIQNKKLDIEFIYGEKLTLKRPHIAYFIYFIGFNIGIIYYYYLDVIKAKMYKEQYQLFKFDFYIMRCIDSMKYKKTFMMFLAFLIVVCSFSFYIVILIHDKNTLDIESSFFLYYYYIYEKKIVCILFAFIVLLLLIESHDKITKKVIGFGIFSRVSFVYIVILDFTCYLFFSFFTIQIFVSYLSLFFFTISMVVIVFFFSILLSIFYYFPLILLYKGLLRKISGSNQILQRENNKIELSE